MTPDELKAWRKAERDRLIAERARVDPAILDRWRRSIEATLERSFPGLSSATVAFCWPMHGEYDARPLAETLRLRGAVTALPVVVAAGQPLVFREWHPGVALAPGPLGIPSPDGSEPVAPTAILVPLTGWDAAGYRLGYGAGFFDRTLATLPRPAVTIGVGYEQARIETIHPQAWDVPMDWIVTERGVYRRDPGGLAFLGGPDPGRPSTVTSPVCYADEIVPDHFGDQER
jgi:5-formyltetrahydrofolate cyclo-ligase